MSSTPLFRSPAQAVWVIGVVLVVLSLAIYGMVRRRQRLLALAEVLDERPTQVKGLIGTQRLEGHYRGRAVTFRHQPGSRYRQEKFQILLACASPLRFGIRVKGFGTRLANQLGLKHDVPIGDPEIDDALAFSSTEPERFMGWLRRTDGTLGSVTDLFTEGNIADVTMEDGSLHATRSGWGSVPSSPDSAREVLDALCGLAGSAESA